MEPWEIFSPSRPYLAHYIRGQTQQLTNGHNTYGWKQQDSNNNKVVILGSLMDLWGPGDLGYSCHSWGFSGVWGIVWIIYSGAIDNSGPLGGFWGSWVPGDPWGWEFWGFFLSLCR